MTSTTLMTFLLSTEPNVRSVQLLGSWDNFSKPYTMERDKRVGAGQWRGCHTFTDIVTEGSSHGSNSRSSGLKMGSTYWYYYLLDDDVEYYNEGEPVTTKCPSLPGQPVNVLHVPIILPDSRAHGRDDSGSSEKSNYRTLNPDDKYLNPRPPPKPQVRLRTSPTLPWRPEWPISTSQDLSSRSNSQPAGPIRAKADDGGDLSNPIPSQSEGRLELASSLTAKATSWNTGKLPFRRSTPADNFESIPLSIQQRRALKSNPRDGSPNGNALTLETQPGNRKLGSNHSKAAKRSPKTKEFIAQKVSPLLLNTTKKLGACGRSTSPKLVNLKKRLPTLPNTPSSVMDEALRDLDCLENELDMEMLGSHFSDATTDGSTTSDSPCEKSHFSEWSTDSEVASPESMISSSTFNIESGASPTDDDADGRPFRTPVPRDYRDPQTPHLTAGLESPSPVSAYGSVSKDLTIPPLSISGSSRRIGIRDLCVDAADQVESNPKRYAAIFEVTEPINALGLRSPDACAANVSYRPGNSQADEHSSTNHDLMDELSYLGSTIEYGTGGGI